MIMIILNLPMRVKKILINLHMPLFPKRNRLFSYPKYEGRGATACVTACLKAVFKLLWWIRGHSYLENPPLWQIWKEKIIWNTFIVRNWIFISFYILVNDTKMVWNIFFQILKNINEGIPGAGASFSGPSLTRTALAPIQFFKGFPSIHILSARINCSRDQDFKKVCKL